MSSRPSGPRLKPASITTCALLILVGLSCLAAGTAHASQYKMVLCAGNVGANAYGTSTNTASPQNPGGIFSFENYCGPGSADPAGNSAFLRIAENQASGNAGAGAYGNIYYDTPPFVHFKAAGGWTASSTPSTTAGGRAFGWRALAAPPRS